MNESLNMADASPGLGTYFKLRQRSSTDAAKRRLQEDYLSLNSDSERLFIHKASSRIAVQLSAESYT
ncbi:hypothetical protein P5673_003962 [Acropora cervicornis]|uniref:Uncharacterized protein n=1 Tax=Acropora cervicornis TaxID=6130 RepID=A0AAD9R239_ACRCE|nr:hypothetical protein P5673_003962 [Acropora cervicornis]